MRARWLLATAACLGLATISGLASDWPQWRGPERTGVAADEKLADTWPEKGPPLVWTAKGIGVGFSGPAVVGDTLYIAGAVEGKTYLMALDVAGGKEQWKAPVGDMFTFEGNKWGDGPRTTPTVDGGHVYALGGFGDLVCVSKGDGKVVWSKNLPKDLGGEVMQDWGYCESVLIDGDRLICTPGGPKGTLAALDKKSGEVVWRSEGLTQQATYASVMPATIEGVRQYLVLSYDEAKGVSLNGVEAETGKLLWQDNYSPRSAYTVAITPVVQGNKVYVEAGDGGGCFLIGVSKSADGWKTESLYNGRTKLVMKNNHGGVVLYEGNVYGHGDQRSGWVCQDFATGKEKWSEPERVPAADGSGSLVIADGKVILYSDAGQVGLIAATPKGFDLQGSFELPMRWEPPADLQVNFVGAHVWTHPVVANGRLYLRDQDYLFCYDVGAKK